MKKYIFLTLLLGIASVSYAQRRSYHRTTPYKNWEIGLSAGVSRFQGTWNFDPSDFLTRYKAENNDLNPGIGLYVRKHLNHWLSFEGNYTGTILSGLRTYEGVTKPYKTGINQFDVCMVWNLNNMLSANKFNRKAYVWLKGGIGLDHIKLTTVPFTHYDFGVDQGIELAIPIGLGFTYRVNEKIKLNMGSTLTFAATHKLDAYWFDKDLEGLPTPESRTIPYAADSYAFTYLGISYVIPHNTKYRSRYNNSRKINGRRFQTKWYRQPGRSVPVL